MVALWARRDYVVVYFKVAISFFSANLSVVYVKFRAFRVFVRFFMLFLSGTFSVAASKGREDFVRSNYFFMRHGWFESVIGHVHFALFGFCSRVSGCFPVRDVGRR